MSGPQRLKQRRSASNSAQACFNCGIAGHFVVACPRPSRESPANLDAIHPTYLPSQIQQYTQQHYPSYPIQQYAPSNQSLIQPAYNGPSTGFLPYTCPSYQPGLYTAPEFAGTLDHSTSIYEPHNHPYVTHSNSYYEAPISNYLYPNSTPNYQLSLEAAYSNSPDRYSLTTPNSCNYQNHHGASFSAPVQEYPKKYNYHFQQPYPSASLSSFSQDKPTIYHNHNQSRKFTSDDARKERSESIKNPHLLKGKPQKSQEIPNERANYSQSSNQNSISERAPVHNKVCIFKSVGRNSDYQNGKSSNKAFIQETHSDENNTMNESEYELWHWEYDAIFKDPPSAEIVALAQPLAAGFKSTPVPLVQAWSRLLPSVSRYARKDNEKEFVRSIRCSHQWSYLQEDPAFMDTKLDGPLIPLEEFHIWLAVRNGAELNSSKTDEKNMASKCRKRERTGRSEYGDKEKNSLGRVGFKFGGETERPPAKKCKSAVFGNQNDQME